MSVNGAGDLQCGYWAVVVGLREGSGCDRVPQAKPRSGLATPKAVIDRLNTSLNETLGSTAVAARMTKEGFDPVPSSPEQARARLGKELPQWAKLIKERGI